MYSSDVVGGASIIMGATAVSTQLPVTGSNFVVELTAGVITGLVAWAIAYSLVNRRRPVSA